MAEESSLPAGVQGGQPGMGNAPAPPPEPAAPPSDSAGIDFVQAAREVLNGNAAQTQVSQDLPANPYQPQIQSPPPPADTAALDQGPQPFNFAPAEPGDAPLGSTPTAGEPEDVGLHPGRAAEQAYHLEQQVQQGRQAAQTGQAQGQGQQLPPRGPDGRFQSPQQQSDFARNLEQAGYNVPEGASDQDLATGFLGYLQQQNGQQQTPVQQQDPSVVLDAARYEAARAAQEAIDRNRQTQQPARPQQITNWRDYTVQDENGEMQFRTGLDGETQRQVMQAVRREREFQQEFAADPRGAIDRHFGDEVNRRAQSIAAEVAQNEVERLRAEMRAQSLVERNEQWMYERDQFGNKITGQDGAPQLTHAGQMVARHAADLGQHGYTNPDEQWDMAMRLAELDYRRQYDQYAYQQAQQQMQQMQMQQNGQQPNGQMNQPGVDTSFPGQQPSVATAPPAQTYPSEPAGQNADHRQNFIADYAQQHVQQQMASGDMTHSPNLGGEIARAADPNMPPADPTQSFRDMAMQLAAQGGLVRAQE